LTEEIAADPMAPLSVAALNTTPINEPSLLIWAYDSAGVWGAAVLASTNRELPLVNATSYSLELLPYNFAEILYQPLSSAPTKLMDWDNGDSRVIVILAGKKRLCGIPSFSADNTMVREVADDIEAVLTVANPFCRVLPNTLLVNRFNEITLQHFVFTTNLFAMAVTTLEVAP
jgi:hypothetical protein